MKAIKNIESLPFLLIAEDPNWQERLYDQTGIIAILRGRDSLLLSNCGYIDLDADATYQYVKGKDATEYCTIDTIKELQDYILQMESYQNHLADKSFGRFTKAELFSTVYAKVISAEENQFRGDGTSHQDWGLSSISTYYYEHKKEDEIVLHMSLIDYDSVEVWIPKDENRELKDFLDLLVKELNFATEDIADIPEYHVQYEKPVYVPRTFGELYAWLQPDGIFGWLS